MADRRSQLSREFYLRNQSERILDKQLFRRSNMESLAKAEKEIYGDPASKKKVKTEESDSKCKLWPGYQEVVPHEALDTVVKYLDVESKTHIAIGKIKYLVASFINELHAMHLLQLRINFKTDHQEKELIEIYTQVEAYVKADALVRPLKLLGLQLKLKNQLSTDDSFVFNNLVKHLGVEFDAFKICKHESTDQIQLDEGDCDYAFQQVADFDRFRTSFEFRQSLRQQFLLNCFEVLLRQHKLPWAKPSVSKFLMDINYNSREAFEGAGLEVFDDLISRMQNAKAAQQADLSRQEVSSQKLMQDYLKPTHDVVDSRQQVSVEADGLNQWHLKQVGL